VPTKKCLSLFHQDKGIKASLGREANVALSRTFPVLPPPRGTDHALDGFNMSDERRSIDDVIPVGRRDIDSKHCQVYYRLSSSQSSS